MRIALSAFSALVLVIAATAQFPAPQILSIEQIRQLEMQVTQQPDNAAAAKLLGANYALAIMGVTSLNKTGTPDKRDLALAAGAFAGHARQALNESKLPGLVAEAVRVLTQSQFGVNFDSMLPMDLRKDAVKLQGSLLDRAVGLDPNDQEVRQLRMEHTERLTSVDGWPGEGLPAKDAWQKVRTDLAVLSGDRGYYALAKAAFLAESAGSPDEASALPNELLQSAERKTPDWNHGNALHAGNSVPGKIALHNGDASAAEAYLLKSASSIPKGSPQLNSFGPNMSLALALLKAGHTQVVLQYFDACRAFWKMGGSKLDTWTAEVRAGVIPQFGGNLVY